MTKFSLQIIDESNVIDHSHIDLADDKCFFFGTYTSNSGFGYSDTNNIVQNLKKSVSVKKSNPPEWRWKIKAINEIANLLAQSFCNNTDIIGNATFIPMPPSKCKSNPEHDDRLVQILQKAFPEGGCKNVQFREVLLNKNDIKAAHTSNGDRPSIDEIYENFQIDQEAAKYVNGKIIIFDDVLSAGCHFKAAKRIIQEFFPDIEIIGVFFARRNFKEMVRRRG